MRAREELTDSFGRKFDYLRISLTDRCNFGCRYCLPTQEDLLRESPLTSPSLLTPAEITRFVQILGHFGRFRIRLTGGEPLLRKDLLEIIGSLKGLDAVKEVSLTTNGSLLNPLIKPLRKAGLDRLNISLDSLDPSRFQQVTLRDLFHKVYKATFSALKAGFPVKINVVALKGLSSEEILNFVTLAVKYPIEIRFLEFMPLCGSNWQKDTFLPVKTIRQTILKEFNMVEEINRGHEVAQTFQLVQGKGKVGFIAPLTEPFCDQCTRMRLTADGKIRPCLFSGVEIPVGTLLKDRASDQEILHAIQKAAWIKPKGSLYYESEFTNHANSPYQNVETPFIRHIGG